MHLRLFVRSTQHILQQLFSGVFFMVNNVIFNICLGYSLDLFMKTSWQMFHIHTVTQRLLRSRSDIKNKTEGAIKSCQVNSTPLFSPARDKLNPQEKTWRVDKKYNHLKVNLLKAWAQ